MNSQTRSGSGLFHRNHEKGSLVITELRMPYLNGIEFASKVRRISPEVKLLLITPLMRQTATMTRFYSSLGFSDMLHKPLLPRSLKMTVENFY
ncbi:MAG TPA: response regulator [Nitrososphaera sp.]|nr:response regulator [Nitrososphaera sp.]